MLVKEDLDVHILYMILSFLQIGDFRVMKDVAEITRLPPARRLSSVQELIKTLNSSPAAAAKLAEWGLEICPGKLPRCLLFLGGGIKGYSGLLNLGNNLKGSAFSTSEQSRFASDVLTNVTLGTLRLTVSR